MRLNTGTLLLILAAVVVIAVVILLNGQPATAPGDPTPTSAAVTGSVFVGVDAPGADSITLTNYESGEFVTFTRDTGGAWDIAGTYSSDVTDPLQDGVVTGIAPIQSLVFLDSFESDQLSGFGLDQPTYTIEVNGADGTQYTLYVGSLNPSGNRYYAVAQTFAGAASTADPNAALSTAETTPEATPEATPDMTAEATADAASTPEAMLDPLSDGAVMDALTLDRALGARPTLSGTQTILLIDNAVIDTLLDLIVAPPYAPPPTATLLPTSTPNPFSEVEQTATAASVFATATAAAQITAEATAEATGEAASEATAEATP